ncbi:hypothetical protein ADUPG1_002610, partial [Aduncisulcus paluster]
MEELLLENEKEIIEMEAVDVVGFAVNSKFKTELAPLVEEFTKGFEIGEKARLPELKIRLKAGCEFKSRQLRRTPLKFRRFMEEEISELKKQGVIRASENPFFSPLVIVPKKGGHLRLCVDYRELNAITIPYPHPLPRIDDCIEALEGQKLFASLDLSKGFHH